MRGPQVPEEVEATAFHSFGGVQGPQAHLESLFRVQGPQAPVGWPCFAGSLPLSIHCSGVSPQSEQQLASLRRNDIKERVKEIMGKETTPYNFSPTHPHIHSTGPTGWRWQSPYLLLFTQCGVVQRRLTIDVPRVDVGTFKQHTGGATRELCVRCCVMMAVSHSAMSNDSMSMCVRAGETLSPHTIHTYPL